MSSQNEMAIRQLGSIMGSQGYGLGAISNAQSALQSQYNNTYNQLNPSMSGYGQQTFSTEDLKKHVKQLTEEIEKREMHDVKRGPTQHELINHESLMNAWNEYLVVRKLLGLK